MGWGDVLHEYSGTFSTILGASISFLGTYIYKNWFGKLRFYFYNETLEMGKWEHGNYIKVSDAIDATAGGVLKVVVDIYNSKEIPISIRKNHVEIENGYSEKEILAYDLEMEEPKIMTFLNLPPKKLFSYKFSIGFDHQELINIVHSKAKIFFVALDQSGKLIKIEIPWSIDN